MTVILKSAFDFLEKLGCNNDRVWFAANKDEYLLELERMVQFADALLQELSRHDVIETQSGGKSLYRIYRDVRFSKDKTPYSTYWGGRFRRAGRQRRGGYYYHFEPGNKSFILCGFWNPNAQDLKLIREDIAFDAEPLRKILSNEGFVSSFGTLQGEQVKTNPRGYEPDHEAIGLLRFKQFLVRRRFTDEEVLNEDFVDLANQTLKNMRPFLDYMSGVLSADQNGSSILPEF
ncbi:MAG: DUF2461 domain-containing protein [Bacteroidota bacterium]|nr:DUF2461 domain-containing protein [Bacteroidota bacterium]